MYLYVSEITRSPTLLATLKHIPVCGECTRLIHTSMLFCTDRHGMENTHQNTDIPEHTFGWLIQNIAQLVLEVLRSDFSR
jgi:hypothetical protein